MFAAVVVCLIDSSFILAWNLTYVNTFFHFFLKTLFFLFLSTNYTFLSIKVDATVRSSGVVILILE